MVVFFQYSIERPFSGTSPTPHNEYSDHRRMVKKRVLTILNAKKEKARQDAYKDFLGPLFLQFADHHLKNTAILKVLINEPLQPFVKQHEGIAAQAVFRQFVSFMVVANRLDMV